MINKRQENKKESHFVKGSQPFHGLNQIPKISISNSSPKTPPQTTAIANLRPLTSNKTFMAKITNVNFSQR